MLSLTGSNGEHTLLTTIATVSLISIPSVYYFLNRSKASQNNKKGANDKFQPPTITPVGDDFEWSKKEPHPYRPFKKGLYKMNLAIRKLDPNDIVCIENTYMDRITLREKLFDETKLYGCDDSALDALHETYRFVFTHLTKRYPKYFVYSEDGTAVCNKITGKQFPSDPSVMEREQVLRTLATNIEEDFLILVKNPSPDQLDEYVLRCAVSLFPAGFNPLEKLNQPLTKIHAPVPGYVQKLQLSMNKFFARLKPYEFIIRNNWSIQTHTNICAPKGSHATLDEAKNIHPSYPEDLDFNKCFFRVEKQCFTRLPETGTDLMFIRTYTTSLMDLRSTLDANEKEILTEAIDGLTGDLAVYKRRIQWGEAAKAFINSESDGSNPVSTKYTFVH